jgi:phage tail-like protein
MANPADETIRQPFTAFNFKVVIDVPGISGEVCAAAFSDCDGLEQSLEVKTIREGGNNTRQIRLPGPAAFGTLTLKRGMTTTFDLWTWFASQLEPGNAKLRGTATVSLLSADGQTERARFVLDRCLPIKLKAPALNAKDGGIAVEELQLAYENLRFVPPSSS